MPLFFLPLLSSGAPEKPSTYKTEENIPYRDAAESKSDAYIAERCRLDIYHPLKRKGFATIVWFHGGGLRGGKKSVPKQLKDKGHAVVAVNYRLFPKVKCPIYIEDAAAAVAWTFMNIRRYGGNPDRIFVSGHSAGGYLTSMVGLDKHYLAKHNIEANRIAGLVPFSGHTITHFTPRQERGIPGGQAIIDRFAPLYHVRPDCPPLILITGDRELEMLGRYEENAYFWRMMKVAKHKSSKLYELQGFNHSGMADPAFGILLRHISSQSKPK